MRLKEIFYFAQNSIRKFWLWNPCRLLSKSLNSIKISLLRSASDMRSVCVGGITSSRFLLMLHHQHPAKSQLIRSGSQLIVERRIFALFEGHDVVAWDGVLNPAIGALAWAGCFGDRLRAVVGVAAVAKIAL